MIDVVSFRTRAVGLGSVLLLASISPTAAQQPSTGIRVLKSHHISTDNPRAPHVETFLAVDPNRPSHLIAASMVGGADAIRFLDTNVYVSFDGGRTWTRSKLAPMDTALATAMIMGGDPIVYINRKGTAFLGLGTRVRGKAQTIVSRSEDGGRTWQSPAVLPYRDRPFMAFDESSTGPLVGTIYLAGGTPHFLLSRSTDDGRTFSFGDVISRDLTGPDPNLPIQGLLRDMLIDQDGRLVMPFGGRLTLGDSVRSGGDSVSLGRIWVLVSDDGGRSFFAARKGPVGRTIGGYRGHQAGAVPRAAIDRSLSPYKGRMYVVRSDWDGGKYVVKLAYSADLGESWNTTIVSDNPAGFDPSNPVVAVNRDGVVAVIWNDRRDDPDGKCWRLYGAVSTDGGASFLPNQRMSEAPTCVNTPENWAVKSWYLQDYWTNPGQPRPGFGFNAFVPVRFPNGGDTQGLVADRDGIFHAAWVNGETGALQLWYTSFEVNDDLLAEIRAQNAAHRSGESVEVPARHVDLTQELEFEMSDPGIDFEAGALQVTMRVVNPTSRAIPGPIRVMVDRLVSERSQAMGLRNLRVANADNGEAGEGAMWEFKAPSRGVLPPKGKSAPRVLRFSFTGGIPDQPYGYFVPVFFIFAPDEP